MKSLIGYRTISWIHLCICLYAYIFFQYSQNTENIAVFDNSFGYSLFLLFFPLEDFKIFCLFTKMSKFCVHMWIGFLKFIPLQEKKLKKNSSRWILSILLIRKLILYYLWKILLFLSSIISLCHLSLLYFSEHFLVKCWTSWDAGFFFIYFSIIFVPLPFYFSLRMPLSSSISVFNDC